MVSQIDAILFINVSEISVCSMSVCALAHDRIKGGFWTGRNHNVGAPQFLKHRPAMKCAYKPRPPVSHVIHLPLCYYQLELSPTGLCARGLRSRCEDNVETFWYKQDPRELARSIYLFSAVASGAVASMKKMDASADGEGKIRRNKFVP